VKLCILSALALVIGWTCAAWADPQALPQTPDSVPAVHAGRILEYSLHGTMAQTIDGNDMLGHPIHQSALPTAIDGHEKIAVKAMSADSMTLGRSGTLTATVAGKSRPLHGFARTQVSSEGTVTRDHGTIGGLFLLPLAFLGEKSMHAGAELSVGDSWSGQLGTKLFGMVERPRLRYSVVGRRSVLGVPVVSIEATGQAKMKKPVTTNGGQNLGNATGSAVIDMRIDYDHDNQRVVSLDLRLHDTLRYANAAGRPRGLVRDREQYLVALDAASMLNGINPSDSVGGHRP